jgi:hypothetical protein
MGKTIKISENQFKNIVKKILNEQRSAGVTNGQTANTVTKNQRVDISSGPNNMGGNRPEDFDAFIKSSKLGCIRNGNLTFGKNQYGFFVEFKFNEDGSERVQIYSNARANLETKDVNGQKIDKMVTARCDVKPPSNIYTIGLYEGGKLIYSFDPKNPIKKQYTKEQLNIMYWQELWKKQGLYKGNIDGKWGKLSQAAYEQYKELQKKKQAINTPSPEPVAEPVAQPVAEPVAQPVAEPVAEPSQETPVSGVQSTPVQNTTTKPLSRREIRQQRRDFRRQQRVR